MKRSIVLSLVSILLVACASPITYPVQAETTTSDGGVLEILNGTHIEPAVDVDFNLQLLATLSHSKWRVVGGFLPTGSMRLSSSGQFSGAATKFGETGSFTIELSNGTQTITRDCTFRVKDVVWVFPARVDVGNFRPGARAEYIIKVHNDDSVTTERKKVGTDNTDVPDAEGFVTVPIPLNQKVHEGLSSVLSIKSDNPKEALRATAYTDNKTIVVKGFLPLTERIIEISYIADSMFSVSYETVDVNVEKWVTISDTSFVLPPHTTKEVLVAVDMPMDAKVNAPEFNFRILTGRAVVAQGPLTFAAVNAVSWTVKMR